jgi:hypothetical protein
MPKYLGINLMKDVKDHYKESFHYKERNRRRHRRVSRWQIIEGL